MTPRSYTTADLCAFGAITVEPTAIVYAFLSLAGEPSEADRALLSHEEQERSSRFVNPADANRYAIAHAGLRLLLALCLGVEPQGLEFEHGSRGKPHLADRSACLEFNLSHADEVGLICAARNRPVGVDVERVRTMHDALSIAEAVFSVTEARRLRDLSDARLPAEFFRLWTRKEAAIKATGEGLSRPLNSLDVDRVAGSESVVTGWTHQLGAASALIVRDLPSPDEYAAAGAVVTLEGSTVEWQQL